MDFQFLDGKKIVVFRMLKINDSGALFLCFSARLFHRDRDPIPNQKIFLLIDLQQGGGGQVMLQFALGLIELNRRDPGIQTQQSLPKIPGQQDLLIAFAAKAAVFAQFLRVVGKGHIPAQLLLEQMPGGFLNEDVFGVFVAHGVTSLSKYICKFSSKFSSFICFHLRISAYLTGRSTFTF